MGVARAIHHRRFCGGFYGGGWHGHRHWHGWHGGGHDPRDGWGGFDHEDHGEFRSPFADADFRGLGGFGPGRIGRREALLRPPDPGAVRATPAQERVIGAAVEEFRDELKKNVGGEGRRTRQEIVEALRRSTFDGVLLGEQFARHDTILENGASRSSAWSPRLRRARARAARAAGRPRREGPALRLDARGLVISQRW